MKSLQNDFRIVLELARQNIIEDPHMTEEAAKQIRACDNVEAFVNEMIRIIGNTENKPMTDTEKAKKLIADGKAVSMSEAKRKVKLMSEKNK